MKKQNHTNSKGVTLVALIITIVVLIIIASIATYSGIDIIRSSGLTSFTTEMKIMQTEVNELYEQWKNGEIIIDDNGNVTIQEDESIQVSIGKDLTYDSDVENQASYVLIHELDLGDTLSDLKGYSYFDYATIEYLGIEGTEGEFFVNIADRKVVSFEGFRYDGVMYYTLEQLPQSLYNVDYAPYQFNVPTFRVDCEMTDENEWKIYVSDISYDGYINKWNIKYQKEGDDYWNTIEDSNFKVNEKGKYIIKVANGNVESEEKEVNIWTQIGTQVVSGTTILEVGDFVDYSHTLDVDMNNESESSYESKVEKNGYATQKFNLNSYVDMNWRVLGEENGNLLLISEKTVGPDSGGYTDSENGNQYYIKGKDGYVNGIEELNNICALFGKARHAERARSVNVDDINRVTGYNPNNVGVYDLNQSGSGVKSFAGSISEYGNEVIYYWQGTANPYYIGSNDVKGNLIYSYTSFNWYDEVEKEWKTSNNSNSATEDKMEQIVSLKNSYYVYYPETLSEKNTDAKVGISKNSTAYNNLFDNINYWLASSYITTGEYTAGCGIRQVDGGIISANSLQYATGPLGTRKYGIRPAVSIKYNLKFVSKDGIWTIEE